ncbi:MAG: carbohydrate kinase family protein, partial [Oscillospiraceae bacterium]|nr:carbohydrate kinase family protein [Oscillospiraceae bacterium]
KSRVESGEAPTFRADKVVDVTGAGDAFAAGLISGVIEKIPLSEAVVRANACGCCAIQSEGFSFPSIQELREYMLTHRFVVDGCKDY